MKKFLIKYCGWFGQPIIHFLKYQKIRRKIGQKIRARLKCYAGACFTSYFVSYFPIFQEMKNTWPHEILPCRVLSYAAAILDKVKINCFEVDYKQKIEVITRDKLYLTRPHIYLLFFQLNIWLVKCRKTYSIVIQRKTQV